MEKSRGRNRRLVQLAVALGATIVMATLYVFAPEEHSFYPRCIFHSLTGWQCPGCGSLRAMHQLLHGNFANAWQLNPLFVLALPLIGILVLRRTVQTRNGQKSSQTKGNYV
jgi:hypothetical protein